MRISTYFIKWLDQGSSDLTEREVTKFPLCFLEALENEDLVAVMFFGAKDQASEALQILRMRFEDEMDAYEEESCGRCNDRD